MKSPLTIVREMFGRQDPTPTWLQRIKFFFNRYSDIESVDFSRSIYALTRAIYYASTVKDKTGDSKGKTYGSKFLLGAVFGKPIINATAAFAFSSPPEVVIKSGKKAEMQKTADFVNGWLRDHKKDYFDVKRWAMRDGDSYIYLRDDLTPKIIPGERIDIMVDPLSGDVTEIHMTSYVKEGESTIKYVTVFTENPPFVELRKYEEGGEKYSVLKQKVSTEKEVPEGVEITEEETSEEDLENRPMDIVEFHNEVDAGNIYGTSEYQNLYYLFANYHAILENAIKNNIFNSNAIPFISGVDEIKTFKEANGERQSDGDYKISISSDDLLIGGKDFKISLVEGSQTAGEANILLKKIFYLIVDGAELPEFVFGTAVQSSKASVSEQMPVMVKKAERKQREQEVYDRNLINTLIYKGFKAGVCPLSQADFDLVYPPIVDKDLKLNLDIVKVLSEEGTITDRTKMILLDMGSVVDDIDGEIERAQKENDIKREAYDAYGSEPKKPESTLPEDEDQGDEES